VGSNSFENGRRDDFTHWFDVLNALRFLGSPLKIKLYLNV
jgi:hypothetical protein